MRKPILKAYKLGDFSRVRVSFVTNNYVYFHLLHKPYLYPKGWSRVIYIGKTDKDWAEMLKSMAAHDQQLLKKLKHKRYGDSFTVALHFISLKEGVSSRKLESAFLHEFEAVYGQPPLLNSQKGSRRDVDYVREYYRVSSDELRRILGEFAKQESPRPIDSTQNAQVPATAANDTAEGSR